MQEIITLRVREKPANNQTYRIAFNNQNERKLFLPGQNNTHGFITRHHFHIGKMIKQPVRTEAGYIKYICKPEGEDHHPSFPEIPAIIEPAGPNHLGNNYD